MKSLIGSFIGLVLVIGVGAEPLLEGRVRLSSGQPVVGVQVRLFDLTDLRRFVGTTTSCSLRKLVMGGRTHGKACKQFERWAALLPQEMETSGRLSVSRSRPM